MSIKVRIHTIRCHKSQEKTHLQATTWMKCSSVLGQEICQHLGDNSQCVAGLRESALRKRYMGVQMSVHPGKTHDGQRLPVRVGR